MSKYNVLKAFGKAAVALCVAHVAAAVFGLWSMHGGSAAKDHFVPATEITVTQKDSLRRDLCTTLCDNRSQHILLGDYNHCDMRLDYFLGDPQTMKLLAQHGVRKIFLELSTASQDEIDAVAEKRRKFLSSFGYTGGREVGNWSAVLLSRLVRNAHAEGIKVYAADANHTFTTFLLAANVLAVREEARVLSFIGLKRFPEWLAIECGLRPLINNRCDDRKVAEFIGNHTAPGERTLTVRGDGHIVYGGENSLRSNLSSCVAISAFSPENTDNPRAHYDDYKFEEILLGQPNYPDYVMNLQSATVYPHPKGPTKTKTAQIAGFNLPPLP